MDDPNTRESRVAVDLLNGASHGECVDGSYGELQDDYSSDETEEDDKDVRNYHESLRPQHITINE